jgi:hypothetical protein
MNHLKKSIFFKIRFTNGLLKTVSENQPVFLHQFLRFYKNRSIFNRFFNLSSKLTSYRSRKTKQGQAKQKKNTKHTVNYSQTYCFFIWLLRHRNQILNQHTPNQSTRPMASLPFPRTKLLCLALLDQHIRPTPKTLTPNVLPMTS